MARERLDALLAHAGWGSRKDVKRFVRAGRVCVDGEICRDPSRIITDPATVTIDGMSAVRDDLPETVLLHKPVGYACSRSPQEAPLIHELLPEDWKHLGLEPAGRLDRETSGLIVLSCDGQLIHQLTHPKRKLPKRYRVGYTGALPSGAESQVARGLQLTGDERPTRPGELTLEGNGQATLVIHEGRNRQVRRMFEALGATVTTLHRDQIGALELPSDLPPGEARPLHEDERRLLLTRDGDETPEP